MIVNRLNARISEHVTIAGNLLILRVVPESWDLPDFKPGQVAALGIPLESSAGRSKMTVRYYSIASSPLTGDYLEFYIGLDVHSRFTERLFDMKAGDPIWLSPRFTGTFILAGVPEDAGIVMVSTSTGVSLFASLVRTELPKQQQRLFALIHGVRNPQQLGYHEEFLKLEEQYPNFTYLPVVSQPEGGKEAWTGQCGYVQEAWGNGVLRERCGESLDPSNTHLFLCGRLKMIQSMQGILTAQQFLLNTPERAGQIHIEYGW